MNFQENMTAIPVHPHGLLEYSAWYANTCLMAGGQSFPLCLCGAQISSPYIHASWLLRDVKYWSNAFAFTRTFVFSFIDTFFC